MHRYARYCATAHVPIIEDLRDSGGPEIRQGDLCIVGGGPAGLAIARAFAGSRYRVYLLESGGQRSEAATHALLDGRSVGEPGVAPGTSRLRAFGGSCRLWGGGCMPLEPAEFERRDWVAGSGWPIAYADLVPHYRDALRLCGLDPAWLDREGLRVRRGRASVAEGVLVEQPFLKSRVEFGEASRDVLACASNVHVLLHANLLALDAGPDADGVREARIGTLEGWRGIVRARHYVLAAGGIENARLLLLSDSVAQAGLGNDRGQVGRWFHEHPRCRLGELVQGRPATLVGRYGRNTSTDGVSYLELALAQDTQRGQRLLATRVRPFPHHAPPSKGMQALRELRSGFAQPSEPPDEATQVEHGVLDVLDTGLTPALPAPDPRRVDRRRALLGVAAHPADIAIGAVRRLHGGTHLRTERIELEGYFEQAPNPDSRITLDNARDALGQRRVRVDWRMTALDRQTHHGAAALFGARMAQACGARFVPAPWVVDPEGAPVLHGSAHHMGSTRMASDPGQGVVDAQCRVHGVDNLYVAGSSVFPTGGWAFPTLTIVALSLRLADHLRARMDALEPYSHVLGL